jgi:hypothetical protein
MLVNMLYLIHPTGWKKVSCHGENTNHKPLVTDESNPSFLRSSTGEREGCFRQLQVDWGKRMRWEKERRGGPSKMEVDRHPGVCSQQLSGGDREDAGTVNARSSRLPYYHFVCQYKLSKQAAAKGAREAACMYRGVGLTTLRACSRIPTFRKSHS